MESATAKEAPVDPRKFIEEQMAAIRATVGSAIAINALSGRVVSSVVTALGHRALGERLKTVFVDNALMRQDEPERVVQTFRSMGIPVQLVDAREEFLSQYDDSYIRKAAIKYKIPYITTLSAAAASVEGIAARRRGGEKVRSLQE
jgi:GMP synthase PP-ATPase subunit